MNWPYFIMYFGLRFIAGAALIFAGWWLNEGNVFGFAIGVCAAALSWLAWKWVEER